MQSVALTFKRDIDFLMSDPSLYFPVLGSTETFEASLMLGIAVEQCGSKDRAVRQLYAGSVEAAGL